MNHLNQIQREFLKLSKLDSKIHKEYEERLELKLLPKECKKITPSVIKQGILKEVRKDGDMVSYARIRSQKTNDKTKYSFAIKHFPLSEESEAEISKALFDSFYPDNVSKPQEKKRYTLDSGWEIDDVKDGGIYAEKEHRKNANVNAPDHWEIKKNGSNV